MRNKIATLFKSFWRLIFELFYAKNNCKTSEKCHISPVVKTRRVCYRAKAEIIFSVSGRGDGLWMKRTCGTPYHFMSEPKNGGLKIL